MSIQSILGKARVGIAGLGGMGSNVAVMLVRSGVRDLVLADFDAVDGSNIARQAYLPRHIGMPKVEALSEILREIDPDVRLDIHNMRLGPDNAFPVFRGCTIVCEAFDDPEQKSMLTETILSSSDDVMMVGCSGMAGYGDPNEIISYRALSRFYVCGDGTSDVSDCEGLNIARVSVCAGHMASTVIRLLLERDGDRQRIASDRLRMKQEDTPMFIKVPPELVGSMIKKGQQND